MNSRLSNRTAIIGFFVVFSTLFIANHACGQQSGAAANDKATLIVDGLVSKVFRSDSSNNEFLVQILIQKSEAMRLDDLKQSIRYPAPGEYVFVQVKLSDSISRSNGRGSLPLPKPDTFIRAKLQAGDHQDWECISETWFQEIDSRPQPETAGNSDNTLGIIAEPVFVASRKALKVTNVDAEGPAAKAGIEVGDILVKANNVEIASTDQLVQQIQNSNGSLKLTVRDVRTGRDMPVDIKWEPAMRRGARTRELGVTTEIAFFGGQAALKVVNVAESSPAQRAGLDKGLIILAANGNPMAKPENLADAERTSSGFLNLRVVDPKNRKERELRVDLR